MLAVADAIYVANFGYAPPSSLGQFAHDVLTTPAGWNLIIVGNGVGLLFAALVLTIGVVSFPLLVDRDVGAAVALLTSIQAVIKNPLTMAVWGLIVAVLLVIGSLPFFGHSTWHLYRKGVEADASPQPQLRPPATERRYAADFPVALLPWRK